jgi:cytochrome c oxidase subunit 2
MRLVSKALAAVFAAVSASVLSAPAFAAEGAPKPWQIWHQNANSEIMRDITWFDHYTLWFIGPIVLFVLALLIIVMVRFSARSNPNPSRTSHNTFIEVVWTIVPILILVAIAIPSFELLDKQLAPEEKPEMTVKATGYQWYWGYEYQDDNALSFDSLMLRDPDEFTSLGKTDGQTYPRLLAVDNELVVPVDTMVRVLVAGAPGDVIHSFTVPSLGFKVDAIPGRLNETWFKAEREGMYYGQCSELCGKDHAFMPIAVRVVSKELYAQWKSAAESDLDAANKQLMSAVETAKNVKLASK